MLMPGSAEHEDGPGPFAAMGLLVVFTVVGLVTLLGVAWLSGALVSEGVKLCEAGWDAVR